MILEGMGHGRRGNCSRQTGSAPKQWLVAKDAIRRENSELHNKNQELWEVILFMFPKKNQLAPRSWSPLALSCLPARVWLSHKPSSI
jgi:hypothetical protein